MAQLGPTLAAAHRATLTAQLRTEGGLAVEVTFQ
jgi:hypothetical protein